MYQLNNLDIIILIVIAISALIALSRGLMKEVLSIVGWVLGVAAIIYLLPVLTPFAKMYIENGWLAGVVTSLFILILFLVCWTLFTGKLVGKVRSSKLSGLDRMLGLFFGIARAFLLIILFYILVSWMIPEDKQSETLRGSKYFQIAGSFAKPLEEMIPQETLDLIKEKTQALSGEEEEAEDTSSSEKDETIELFEKLAQPKVKRKIKEQSKRIKEEFGGYHKSEREDLDRLIDSVE